MLVLSRKISESIRIAETIEITVLEIRGRQVRLGIKAPRGVRIVRSELWVAVQPERELVPQSA